MNGAGQVSRNAGASPSAALLSITAELLARTPRSLEIRANRDAAVDFGSEARYETQIFAQASRSVFLSCSWAAASSIEKSVRFKLLSWRLLPPISGTAAETAGASGVNGSRGTTAPSTIGLACPPTAARAPTIISNGAAEAHFWEAELASTRSAFRVAISLVPERSAATISIAARWNSPFAEGIAHQVTDLRRTSRLAKYHHSPRIATEVSDLVAHALERQDDVHHSGHTRLSEFRRHIAKR
jgi:hypothetical protein